MLSNEEDDFVFIRENTCLGIFDYLTLGIPLALNKFLEYTGTYHEDPSERPNTLLSIVLFPLTIIDMFENNSTPSTPQPTQQCDLNALPTFTQTGPWI